MLAGILTLAVFYPAAAGGRLAAGAAEELWFPGLFAGHGLLVIFLAGWWWLRPTGAPEFLAMGFEQLSADVRHGIVVGLAGWFITITVTMAVAAAVFAAGGTAVQPQEIPAVMVWLAGLSLGHKLLVIGVAMTVEELFFRGFLQQRFGLALSSVLFTLAHAGYGLPFMMVSVLTISLLIGRALQQRGRLLPCIVAHGVFDAIQLLLILPWAVRMIERGA